MSNADDRSRLKSDVNLEEIRAQARRSAERIQAPPAGGVRSCKRSKPETKSRQVKGGIFGLFTKTEYYTEDVEYLEEKRVCQDHWVLGRRHEEIVSDLGSEYVRGNVQVKETDIFYCLGSDGELFTLWEITTRYGGLLKVVN